MKRYVALSLDAEYVSLLCVYNTDSIAEALDENAYWASEAKTQAAEIEQERAAFQAHYETDNEAREEIERDDARYGTFAELLELN